MATPIIKWAGGKRQLLPEIRKRMPKEFNWYYEPFFGGGALFFDLKPKFAVINDTNEQLINMYQQIRDNWVEVCLYLTTFEHIYNGLPDDEHKTEYYFKLRKQFNKHIKEREFSTQSAAELIFLNKAGYNGLYSVNKNSELNVPPAHKKIVMSFDIDNVKEVSQLLKNKMIKCEDFKNACIGAQQGDFIFFDSPYYETFDTYQADGFTQNDHLRLVNLADALTDSRVKWMMTYNDCDYIKTLYKGYYIDEVDVRRNINSDATKRTGKEIIIRNYKE